MESALDVILFSERIVTLETVFAAILTAILVGAFILSLIKKMQANNKIANMTFRERESLIDTHERIAAAEKLLGQTPTSCGEHDSHRYSRERLEGKLLQMTPAQRKEWSAWQAHLSKSQSQTEDERREAALVAQYGLLSPTLYCPHCSVTGKVRIKSVELGSGDVTGKFEVPAFAGPAMTGGASFLDGFEAVKFVKKKQDNFFCGNCRKSWF
jgi:hypothetical protein